ncbi:T9SS type A sorting domain-containing protein [Winogradskyella vincentii]|uniref:T9SS type A sorting domain-containing protein n=1 Tax=Winogradskyella vincentii TaxID=2877122 RepID=A0ABS7XZZ2_9FLAO|nr:T9SS type A sorting domain-containing protein [Winogradskyella vincentii]MCA0153218.1 T9SS type A sorting domain-containing protein [Winogradskyella vincentii]
MIKKYTLTCLLFLFGYIGFTQSIIRGPYLQKGTQTSVVIKWRTDSNDSSIIEYSTDSAFGTFTTFSDSTLKSDHEAEITGLTSGTVYYYRIGIGGGLLPNDSELYFKTHPVIGSTDPYTFWIAGGIGQAGFSSANAVAVEVRDAYYSYIGNDITDGIILTGDNADSKGTDAQFQTHLFNVYNDKIKNSILWATLGNIDGKFVNNTTAPIGAYYDVFTFPTSGESGGLASGTESYYSFDYGNIHFIVLNSHDEDRSVGSTMYNWALNDIQSTTQEWIIGIWHHPPYSKGYHTSEGLQYVGTPAEIQLIEMRENIIPMLEANGIDLVISGHTEVYERSYFINGHYGESASFDFATHAVGPNGEGDGKLNGDGVYSKSLIGQNANIGTVYSVNATASRDANCECDHNAMYYSVKQYGTGILEVEGNTLSMKFLNRFGVIEDQFSIHKGPDYIFDGSWQDGNNPNGLSTDLEDIAIVSGTASISSNTTSNTVVVNPGAKLSIDSGVSLTANTIVLESDSDNYSVLNPSTSSTVNGKTKYERYTNQIGSGSSGGNDLIASPLTSGTMETFGAFADWNKNMSALNDIRAFAPYNNNSGNFENYNVVSNETTQLEPGKGYRAATDDGSPLVFTGNVSIGNVNTTISTGTSSIWNLVGNPYTSYLDSQEFLDVNGALGSDVLDSSFNAVYGYNAGTDGTGIWTIINNVQNIGKNIAPGQGFFVASNGTGGANNLSFTPDMRTLNGTDDFILGRQNQENTISHLELSIENSSISYETDFYFTNNSTLGLDPGYDAGSFDSQNSEFALYSHLVNDNNGVNMAIQAMSIEDMNDVSIPLGLNSQPGESVTFQISQSNLPGSINVYLEDNIENTFTLLNSNDYTFTSSEELNGVGRFFLHFSASILSLQGDELNGLQIYTTASPETINVNGRLFGPSILNLYDMQGRLVITDVLNHNSNINSIDVESLNSGVYIVKLKVGNHIRTEKVIIR